MAAVIGIASDELAQRQVPRLLEHLGLDLEAVAEQDHDQRDDREVADEPDVRVEARAPEPARRRARTRRARTAPSATGSCGARCPESSAPPTSSAPSTSEWPSSRRRSSRVAGLRRSQRGDESTVRITVLGKSPSWQDADGACSGYLVEEDGDVPAARLRQRRVLQAAPLPRLRRRRRGRHLAPARRPLPRPRPVRLRADLRAAPAAGAGRPLAGHRPPGAPAAVRAARRARDVPPRRRGVGQRGPHRERLRRCASTTRPTTLDVGPLRISFHEVPHFTDRRSRSRSPRRTAAGASPTAPTAAPNDELVAFADGTDLLLDRGDAAAARSARAPRGHLTPSEAGDARPRARAPGASSSPTSPTSSTSCGRASEAEEAFGGPVVGRARGRRLHGLTAPPAALVRASPGYSESHASRARSVRELRAHAPRDGRAVRRRLRRAPAWRPPARRLLARRSTSSTGRPAARRRAGRAGRASIRTS